MIYLYRNVLCCSLRGWLERALCISKGTLACSPSTSGKPFAATLFAMSRRERRVPNL